jgi:hypothetical protein
MITLDEAKELNYREALIDCNGKRWYVSGAVQRWKKDPDRIREHSTRSVCSRCFDDRGLR